MTISAHLTNREGEMVNTLLTRGRKSEASAIARVFVAASDGSGWQRVGCGLACFVRDSISKGFFLCTFDITEQKEILKEEIYSKFIFQRPHDLFMIFEGEKDVFGLNFYEKREADLLIGRIDQLVFQRRQRKGTTIAKPTPSCVRVGVTDESSNPGQVAVGINREPEPGRQMGVDDKNATIKKSSVSNFFGNLKGKMDRTNTAPNPEVSARPQISGPLTFQHVSSGSPANKQGVQILQQPQILEGKTEDEKNDVAVAILRMISNDQGAGNQIDYKDEKLLKQIRSMLDTHETTDLEEFKKLLGLSEPTVSISAPIQNTAKTTRPSPARNSGRNASSIRVKPRPPPALVASSHHTVRPSVPPPKPPSTSKIPNQQTRKPPPSAGPTAPPPGVPPPPGPPPPVAPPGPPPPPCPGVPPVPSPPGAPGSNGPPAPAASDDDARANVMAAIRNAGGIGKLKKAEDRAEPEKPKSQSSGDARDDLLAAIRNASKNNLKKIEVDPEKEEKRKEDFKSQQVQEKFVGLIDQLQMFRSNMHADSDDEEDDDVDDFDDFDGED